MCTHEARDVGRGQEREEDRIGITFKRKQLVYKVNFQSKYQGIERKSESIESVHGVLVFTERIVC